MNTIFLFFLLFNFKALAAGNCEFTAEVYPKIFKKDTEDIYKETCHWFYKNFNLYPLSDLQSVSYVESWEDINQSIKFKNPADHMDKERLKGIFCCMKEEEKNKIYIHSYTYKNQPSIYAKSILAHEITHFLIKSASFKQIKETKAFQNPTMMETFAYWAQNKFIERHSNKTLWNFTKKKYNKYTIATRFPITADAFYFTFYDVFIYNSILFFDTDTKKKYNKLVTNKFPRDPMPPGLDF